MRNPLDDYAAEIARRLAASVREDIANATHDLVDGPLYLDEDDEPCSCFDDGARRFNFSAAVDRIRGAFDGVGDVWVDLFSGEVLGSEPGGYEDENGEWVEPEWQYIRHYDRRQVLAEIVDAPLLEYVT